MPVQAHLWTANADKAGHDRATLQLEGPTATAAGHVAHMFRGYCQFINVAFAGVGFGFRFTPDTLRVCFDNCASLLSPSKTAHRDSEPTGYIQTLANGGCLEEIGRSSSLLAWKIKLLCAAADFALALSATLLKCENDGQSCRGLQ